MVDQMTPEDKETYNLIDLERAEELAEERDCDLFIPMDNQLTLDIDGADAYANFQMVYGKLTTELGWNCAVDEWFSSSGHPHRHIVITVQDERFSEQARIMWQLILGSDPIRERMNAQRHAYGSHNPTRLFKPRRG